jgi:peroxiredoxin 2/4
MENNTDKNVCCCNVQIGKSAPEFEAEGYFKGNIEKYSLDKYRGKWVLLFFYPLDFTFVCPTELIELNKKSKEFSALNVQILGISVDSVYSHKAWMKELGDFDYPLLSDITKTVSKSYNVLLREKGISLRGAFIINPDGVLKSYIVNDTSVGRNADELLRLIKAFQTGDLCPASWKPGDKTIGKA